MKRPAMAEPPNGETTVAEQAAALGEQNAPKTPEKKENESRKEATKKATPKKATTPKAATPKSHAKSPSAAEKATGLKRPATSGKAKAAAKVKPTTKVKKVPKSQAKAKSTPKAAPKAGSNKPKHTDEQSEQEQKKEPPKKKGKETLKDQAMKWVDNLDKPEDEEKDNTTEAKAEERDRQKAQKFRKLEKAGALPAEVKEAFDAAEKSQNPRANKTQLTNSLFRKEGNNFVMVPKDPAFKRVQKLLDVKYGKEEAQSYLDASLQLTRYTQYTHTNVYVWKNQRHIHMWYLFGEANSDGEGTCATCRQSCWSPLWASLWKQYILPKKHIIHLGLPGFAFLDFMKNVHLNVFK